MLISFQIWYFITLSVSTAKCHFYGNSTFDFESQLSFSCSWNCTPTNPLFEYSSSNTMERIFRIRFIFYLLQITTLIYKYSTLIKLVVFKVLAKSQISNLIEIDNRFYLAEMDSCDKIVKLDSGKSFLVPKTGWWIVLMTRATVFCLNGQFVN